MNVLGIDPGRTVGLCLRRTTDPVAQIFELGSYGFWDALDLFDAWTIRQQVDLVVLERPGRVGTYARTARSVGQKEVRKLVKIARDVGRVDGQVALLTEWFGDKGVPVWVRGPVGSRKWDKAAFDQQVLNSAGYPRTNEHQRDAARLVYTFQSGDVRLTKAKIAARAT